MWEASTPEPQRCSENVFFGHIDGGSRNLFATGFPLRPELEQAALAASLRSQLSHPGTLNPKPYKKTLNYSPEIVTWFV